MGKMSSTFFFILFLVLNFEFVAAKCPEGSVYYSDRSECIYPVNAKTNYTEAKRVCGNFNGNILKIHDIFENVMAGSEAQIAIAPNSQSFIGVIKGSDGTWISDDGTPLQYQNWRTGHPQANMSCAVQSAQNYQWTSVACGSSYTFICSIPVQICPDEWVAYNGMCYYFYDPQLRFLIGTYRPEQARAACQSMSANLTSIHSNEEYNFLKDQIYTSNLTITDSNYNCAYGQAVIGLSCKNDEYKWDDGTAFNFNKTKKCAGSYGIINDDKCFESPYWDGWEDTMSYFRYICKKRPDSQ